MALLPLHVVHLWGPFRPRKKGQQVNKTRRLAELKPLARPSKWIQDLDEQNPWWLHPIQQNHSEHRCFFPLIIGEKKKSLKAITLLKIWPLKFYQLFWGICRTLKNGHCNQGPFASGRGIRIATCRKSFEDFEECPVGWSQPSTNLNDSNHFVEIGHLSSIPKIGIKTMSFSGRIETTTPDILIKK